MSHSPPRRRSSRRSPVGVPSGSRAEFVVRPLKIVPRRRTAARRADAAAANRHRPSATVTARPSATTMSVRVRTCPCRRATAASRPEVDGLKGASDRNGKRPLLGAKGTLQNWLEYHPAPDEPDTYLITALRATRPWTVRAGERGDDSPDYGRHHGENEHPEADVPARHAAYLRHDSQARPRPPRRHHQIPHWTPATTDCPTAGRVGSEARRRERPSAPRERAAWSARKRPLGVRPGSPTVPRD